MRKIQRERENKQWTWDRCRAWYIQCSEMYSSSSVVLAKVVPCLCFKTLVIVRSNILSHHISSSSFSVLSKPRFRLFSFCCCWDIQIFSYFQVMSFVPTQSQHYLYSIFVCGHAHWCYELGQHWVIVAKNNWEGKAVMQKPVSKNEEWAAWEVLEAVEKKKKDVAEEGRESQNASWYPKTKVTAAVPWCRIVHSLEWTIIYRP